MFNFLDKKKKTRNTILSLSIGVMLFVQMLGFVLLAPPAHAQLTVTAPGTDSILLGTHAKQMANDAQKQVKQSIGEALFASMLGALVQGFSYFMRKLAFDAANYIANGGKGQAALVYRGPPGRYIGNTIKDSVATAVEELGQPYGLNLCSPPDINVQIYLTVGLRGIYADPETRPQPSCRWNQLRDNWRNAGDSLDPFGGTGEPRNVAELFSRSVRVQNDTDFGIALGAIAEVDRIAADARVNSALERIEGEGFKSLTNLISGDIKTPAFLVREESRAVTANNNADLTASQIAGIYGASAKQVLPLAGSVFLNTLTSELLNNILTDGFISDSRRGSSGGGGADARDFAGGTFNTNRQAAEQAFSFLLTTIPTRLSEVDIVASYHSCPQNPGLNNCVMDDGLFDAISRAQRGQQLLTIREAMDEGLLHEDWPLITPSRVADNGDVRGCKDNKYCFSNIQKLRKLRILPLGFEIAALRSDPDEPWTLGDVVRNFENCGERNIDGSASYDPEFPYCHLIDPNWVIKGPVARCEANVFGPELLAENTLDRREECVDVSTCVAFDADGTCVQYGYCTREENVWDIPGETCDAHFATCDTYVNEETGSIASYLSRTLDFGACDADSVGCRAYSTEFIGDGEWVTTADAARDVLPIEGATLAEYRAAGRNPIIHYNNGILGETCPAGEAGCATLQLAQDVGDGIIDRGASINIQKAPAHLGCYDIDPTTPVVDYPTTQAELALLEPSEQCGNYAQACTIEEVGCDGHVPQNGDPTVIPGVVGANACTRECVGYDAYSQVASNFEGAVDPLYFIPDNGISCPTQAVGCSEFTNLDELASGGEGLEYYSSIKYCEKPEGDDRTNEKVFFTWEGSAETGLVIRQHRLKVVDADEARLLQDLLPGTLERDELAQIGSPSYADLSRAALEENFERCNAANYRSVLESEVSADEDCREMFDDDGNTYYRLLEETVTVSEQCAPLRASEPHTYIDTSITSQATCDIANGGDGSLWDAGAGTCSRCMGGGRYEDGACIYSGIASESNQCTPAFNGCRAYAGNFSSNVFAVYVADFEPASEEADALLEARDGWDTGTVVAESLQVGGFSLSVDEAEANYTLAAGELRSLASTNLTYEISFWARANSAQTLDIVFYQGATEVGRATPVGSPLSLGNAWQRYTVGPINFSGSEDEPTEMRFTRTAGEAAPYFVDNIRMTRVEDTVPLIKDSWKTDEGYDAPLACDTNPLDAFPGEFLGCESYVAESDRGLVYATGFEQLCRPEAIGCRAFFDTYNTPEEYATGYNLWCASDVAGPCTLTFEHDGVTRSAGCQVLPGDTGCYVSKIEFPDNIDLNTVVLEPSVADSDSAVIIPADTPLDSPFYLTLRPEFACDGQQYLGCQEIALEEQILPGESAASYNFIPTYLINNPANYSTSSQNPSSVLCTGDEVGCSAFSSNESIRYFKDPALIGNKMCTYRAGDGSGIAGTSGWFMDGVGRCEIPSTDGSPATITDELCRSASDCSVEEATCGNMGNVACYADFIEDLSFGIYSNGSPSYDEFVGACPSNQNQCTEFIDRADVTADDPEGTPYYIIFDETVQSAIGECGGQVSLREGCVLFDQTDNPTKLYNVEATYGESEETVREFEYGSGEPDRISLVDPVSNSENDSNIILSVGRDRQCSAWLACKNEVTYRDESGKPIRLCYDYAECTEADGERCASFAETSNDYSAQYLDQDQYVSRDTSWYGEDYSGLSLFEHFPVADLTYAAIEGVDPTATFLTYPISDTMFSDVVSQGCLDEDDDAKADWSSCGLDGGGRCFSGSCTYPSDGLFPTGYDEEDFVANPNEYLEGNSCKGFPESSSPFSHAVLGGAFNELSIEGEDLYRRNFPFRQALYNQANICQDGECSCAYQKITQYNGEVDYWPADESNVAKGICAGGGSRDGFPCVAEPLDPNGPGANNECVDPNDALDVGICRNATLIEKRLGTFGYCLERDFSRPINGGTEFACLTWLPLQISASRFDIFNQDLATGYYPVPQFDAPAGGGQVMCTHGTARGAGAYDEDAVISNPEIRLVAGDGPSGEASSIGQLNGQLSSNHPFYGEQTVTTFPYSSITGINGIDNHRVALRYFYTSGRPCAIGDGERAYDAGYYLASQPLDRIFNENGSPNIGPLYYHCPQSVSLRADCPANLNDIRVDTFGPILYSDYACLSQGTEQEKKEYTTLLSLWGMRQFGTNATLLRTEYGVHIDNDRDDWGWWDGDADGNDECTGDGEECQTIALFPQVFRNTGVLMHPPRSFSGTQPIGRMQTRRVDGIGSGKDPDEGRLVYTDAHSATETVSAEIQDRLYISDIQQNLHESEIDDIYIVPTAYPGGVDSRMPALMSSQLQIDIDALRAALDNDPSQAFDFRGGELLLVGDDDSNETFPSTRRNDTGLNVYTYALERKDGASDCHGLLSYCNYNNRETNYTVDDIELEPEHEIHRRYVLAVYADEMQAIDGFQMRESGVPTGNGDDDPFTSFCNNRGGRSGVGHNSYFVVGLDFNKDGQFLGYISRFCGEDPGTDQEQGIMTAVFATLKDRCIGFASVYDESAEANPEQTTNKAWTNNVWRYAKAQSPTADEGNTALNLLSNGAAGQLYSYEGSLVSLFDPPFTAQGAHVVPVTQGAQPYGSLRDVKADDIVEAQRTLREYVFTDASVGLPLSCPQLDEQSVLRSSNVFDQYYGCYAMLGQTLAEYRSIVEGNGYPVNLIRHVSAGQDSKTGAFAKMSENLFAKTYTWVEYTDLRGTSYEELSRAQEVTTAGDDTVDANYKDVSENDYGLHAPRVYSLNPETCSNNFELAGQGGCTAAELDAMSINGQNSTVIDYDGDGSPNNDANQNGEPDNFDLIGEGSFFATARFFAFADHNRMPIKSVIMDWQDNSNNLIDIGGAGRYANRKPYCAALSDASDIGECGIPGLSMGVTCQSDIDCSAVSGPFGAGTSCIFPEDGDPGLFGNSPRACQPTHFEYSHTYTCGISDWVINGEQTVADVANEDMQNRLLDHFNLSSTSPVCIYQPRVQVRDNWGWCNGAGGRGYQDLSDQNPRIGDTCDRNDDAYTYYDGEIVVILER